jgi:hypothetical protein
VPGGRAAGLRLRLTVRRAGSSTRGNSLTDYELGVLSQNGEDGVLQEVLRRIGSRSRYFVEFGASRGEQANCVLLADYYRWHGLFIESSSDDYAALESKYRGNRRVMTRHELVTADNIQALLRDAGVPEVFDVLSIDIDGNDFWVWRAAHSFTARVVVVEYNGNLAMDDQLVMPRDDEHRWDGSDYFGASLGAYRELAAKKGYELVHTDSTGVNAFFVLREEAAAFSALGRAVARAPNYLGRGLRLPRDPRGRAFHDLATGKLADAKRQPE